MHLSPFQKKLNECRVKDRAFLSANSLRATVLFGLFEVDLWHLDALPELKLLWNPV